MQPAGWGAAVGATPTALSISDTGDVQVLQILMITGILAFILWNDMEKSFQSRAAVFVNNSFSKTCPKPSFLSYIHHAMLGKRREQGGPVLFEVQI